MKSQPHGNTGLRNAARGPVSSTEFIRIRVTDAEKRSIFDAAARVRLKVSEYIRRKLLVEPRTLNADKPKGLG